MATIAESLVAYVGADITEYVRKVGGAVPRIARAASRTIYALGKVGKLSFEAMGLATKVAHRSLAVLHLGLRTVAVGIGTLAAVGKAGFKALVGAVRSATRAAWGLLRAVKNVAGRVVGFATGILRKAFYVLAAGIAAAKYQAISFQYAMAEVGSIAGRSVRDMEKYGQAVQALAIRYGKAPTEMARGLYQVISAGVTNPRDAVRMLDAASKAAVAGLSDTRTAVDLLTTIVNAYGMSMKDVGKVSDIVFATVREGKTTFPELAASMGRVAAIAAQTKVPLADIAAATATLTKGGISTEEAMTALRQTLISILKPGKAAQMMAKELNINLSAQALAAKGLGGVLGDVAKKTRGNATAMAVLFPNIRALSGVMNLAGSQAGEFQKQLVKMREAAGATNTAFGWMADTTKFKLQQAWSAMRVALEKIGKLLMPLVEKAAVVWRDRWIKIAKWVDENSDKIKETVRSLAVRVVALQNWLWRKALATWAWIRGDHSDMWEMIKAKATEAWTWMNTKWETAWNTILTTTRNAWNVLRQIWEAAKPVLKPAWDGLHAAMQGDWETALAGLSKALEEATAILAEVLLKAIPILVPPAVKLGFAIGVAIAKGVAKGFHNAVTEYIPGKVGGYLSEQIALGGIEGGSGSLLSRKDVESVKAGHVAAKGFANITNNFFYPTGRDMGEKLARDIDRADRRGRLQPALAR